VVSGETVLTEDLLCCSFVVASLTGSVLERVKKIDRKLDELRTFLEDVFLTPEESVLLKDADRLVKGKKFEELTSLDDV
jgi:alkylhydroperoxidase family enzyme